MGFLDFLNKTIQDTAHHASKNKNLSDEQREKWRRVEEEAKYAQSERNNGRKKGYDD